jgi:serine/threonine protein kinase
MGEVYRAKDTKLARDVALKILPESFIHDVDRVARFRREAQLLASLNHPNIAAIYGFEEWDGVRALVLELVDGPTLADRIVHGAIPIEEALPIARQIADALEAAHEQGVVHRDLKPANIKLRPDGRVRFTCRRRDPLPAPGSYKRLFRGLHPSRSRPPSVPGMGVATSRSI